MVSNQAGLTDISIAFAVSGVGAKQPTERCHLPEPILSVTLDQSIKVRIFAAELMQEIMICQAEVTVQRADECVQVSFTLLLLLCESELSF